MARIRRNSVEKANTRTPLLWRLGKYIRLSRDDGSGESESESITNQRKILDEQIPGYFRDDYVIVDEYIDDGRTGTSDTTRPEFLRLVEDVKSGRINCIVTKNLSRAFRNSANQGKFLEEFIPLYNPRFISLYEPRIDTFLNPEVVHSLEVSITGFMNEQYAYKTSVDIRRTFDTKRKNGEFIGAFAPYGYKKDPENRNALLVDEEAAEVVRQIYSWFVEDGMSKEGISRRLNELGILNPAAYKRSKGLKYNSPQTKNNDGLWWAKSVSDILQNQMYLGNMVQGKQKVISYKVHDRISTDPSKWYIVENTHEPIVERETFQKAQALQLRDTRVPPGQTKLHLFAGFLRCSDCKKSMTRRGNKGYFYYACSTYCRKSKAACTKHTIRESLLEQAVLVAIQKQIALVDHLSELIDEINQAPVVHTESQRIAQQLAAKRQELAKLNDVIDSLYMDWRTGEITKAEYHRMKEKFSGKGEQLQTVIENLEREQQALSQGVNGQDPYLETFLKYRNIDHLERGILVELVDTIYVHEGKELTIQFNFADQYKRIMEYIQCNRPESGLLGESQAE